MPKKACCCVGDNYLAVPCRFVSAGRFSEGIPQWAHYAIGSPVTIPGFGVQQDDLRGPFRYVNGQQVFDASRQIRYLLRGAGGGASGVTFEIGLYDGIGGNGSYIEYQKNASLDDVVKSGAGGSGGWTNVLWDSIPETYQNGGEAYAINGDGGGGSVIGNGTNWYQNPIAVAGGGGGAGYALSATPAELVLFNGGKYGGDAGITAGYPGEPGVYYEAFNPSPPPPGLCGSGGGGTQTNGGSGGGGGINDRAKDGTKLSGGKGSVRVGPNAIKGSGGGGGGGLYGGGGGAWDAGGGGGSSTIFAGLSAYAFESKNDLSANYCNPWMTETSGVGGRTQPLNGGINGSNGEVVQYYIRGECECDPRKNELPEKVFICLTKIQYDQIVEDLGPVPPGGGFQGGYTPLFTIGDEDYVLLGLCDQSCEEIYKVPTTTDIVDARWSLNDRDGDWGGGFNQPIGPACCSQIVCSPLCPLTGVNCANCGCDPFNEVFVCCNTKGKPDQYLSVYNGWIYSCSKSNNNWIIPGQVTENVTKQCLDPIGGPQPICNQPSQETCTKTVDIPYTDCHVSYLENCQLSISVQGPTVHYQYFGGPPCVGSYSYAIQGVISLIGGGNYLAGSTTVDRPDPEDPCPNPFGPSYTLSTQILFSPANSPTETPDEPIFSIEYDCVPTIEPSIQSASGIWKICDAEVNVIKGPFSNIITEFNSILGGRVTLTNLGGSYYVGGDFPDRITRTVRTIADGKATYTVYATHSYFIPCGLVIYSGLGPEGPRSPEFGSGLRDALRPVVSYFEGAQQDAWQTLSSLNLVMCPCTITRDPGNPLFGYPTVTCPTSPPCVSGAGETVEDPYCGEMTVS